MGPEVDVVPEECGCLVAVDGTADVGEDAHVVEGRQLLGLEAKTITKAHGDPSRAQHVLGGLTEAQVGGKRQCHKQVSQPNSGI